MKNILEYLKRTSFLKQGLNYYTDKNFIEYRINVSENSVNETYYINMVGSSRISIYSFELKFLGYKN